MNYSKIRILQTQKNLSDRKFSASIGMSGPGFKTMMEKQTCGVELLETICRVYNLPISHFFEENEFYVSEPETRYGRCKECIKKDGQLEMLKEQLEKKDAEIARMNRELGRKHPGESAKVG